MAALAAKRDWGRRAGVRVDLVSQFCFESAPILAWLKELEAHGLDLPVHIGLAGPASPATLAKFALRCGVGASLRSLRDHIGRFGRLLMEDGPDDVLRGLVDVALDRENPDRWTSLLSIRRPQQDQPMAA